MAAILQPEGLGTLAYPFYAIEYARDPKPLPTVADATLYILETRETFVWREGKWLLYAGAQVFTDPALADLAASNRLILREMRLLRQGLIDASTANEYRGAPEELDEPM